MILLAIILVVATLIWTAAISKRIGWTSFYLSFPILGIVAVIFGSVFGYDFFHIPAPIPITSDRAVIGLMTGIFSILVVRNRQTLNLPTQVDWAIGMLLLTIILSIALTDAGYKGNLPVSRLIFFYLLPTILYFVVRNSKVSEFEVKIIGYSFLFFCIYLSLTAFAETREWHAFVYPSYIYDPTKVEFLGRGRGPFLNPISNGVFMSTGLAIAFVMWRFSTGKVKWILAASIPIILLGIYSTLTRSVWMGAIIIAAIFGWNYTDRRQKAICIMAATVIAFAGFFAVGANVFKFKRDKYVSANEMSKSAELRPIFAEIAWAMFQDRPLLGCGFGQYNRDKIAYMQDPHSKLQLAKAKPYLQHNVFLSLLTETGLIGCGALMFFLFSAGCIGFKLIFASDQPTLTNSFGLVLLSFLISYVVNGMFHDTSIIPQANILFMYWLAICTSLHQRHFPQNDTIKMTALGGPETHSEQTYSKRVA